MPFMLPPLPFEKNQLEPHISVETIDFHYGKHHKAYVDKLNDLLAGKPEANQSLEEVIRSAEPGPVFNNAAQAWNHTFYWNGVAPGGSKVPADLDAAIRRDFGSLDKLKELLQDAAVTQFGSGWAWLVLDSGTLKVTKTSNADLPTKHNQTPLLTIDVWEHAYYIDYRNARAKYVATVLANLVNWDFVARNLKAASVKAGSR
jgi:Fe-Mn family superoxide dismutase